MEKCYFYTYSYCKNSDGSKWIYASVKQALKKFICFASVNFVWNCYSKIFIVQWNIYMYIFFCIIYPTDCFPIKLIIRKHVFKETHFYKASVHRPIDHYIIIRGLFSCAILYASPSHESLNEETWTETTHTQTHIHIHATICSNKSHIR